MENKNDIKSFFTDEKIIELAYEKYPRLINDSYNPQDDDNKDYRDLYIDGMRDTFLKEENIKDVCVVEEIEDEGNIFLLLEKIKYKDEGKLRGSNITFDFIIKVREMFMKYDEQDLIDELYKMDELNFNQCVLKLIDVKAGGYGEMDDFKIVGDDKKYGIKLISILYDKTLQVKLDKLRNFLY